MRNKKFHPVIVMAMIVSILLSALTPKTVSALSANDGFNPGANLEVKTIALQSTGKILVGGLFTQLGGDSRNRIGRLNPDGSLDTAFNPNANGEVNVIVVQPDDRILVGGSFTSIAGSTRWNLARLNSDGTNHGTFNHRTDEQVHTIALQADGRILVGGEFTGIFVGTSPYDRLHILRLNADGTMDNSFKPNFNGTVYAITVQADGRIMVGGDFSTVNGQSRNNIVRLNKDGSIDTTFSASTAGSVRAVAVQLDGKVLIGGTFSIVNVTTTRPGFARLYRNGALDFSVNMDLAGGTQDVFSLAVQADGKVLIGGNFESLKTEPRTHIGRMNPDGTLDMDFIPSLGGLPGIQVSTIAVQPDGKILLGGTFTQSGGLSYLRIMRCYPDGSTEQALTTVANNLINAVAIQPDGGILVGGNFTSLDSVLHYGLGRILPGGMMDHGFVAGMDGAVYALAVQSDGKILVGGDFTLLNTETRHNLGRLNADGTLDTAFATFVNGPVYAFALDQFGRIIIGGDFSMVGSTSTENLARLNSDGTVDKTFKTFSFGTGDKVYAVAYQNGKILVGGDFWSINGNTSINHLARVANDGTLEIAYNPCPNKTVRTILPHSDGAHLIGGDFNQLGVSGSQVTKSRLAKIASDGTLVTSFEGYANNSVYTMVEQADGKIVVGGLFTLLSGIVRNYLGRFNADGSLDSGFNPGANASVLGLAIQPDGKIIAVGNFSNLAGSPRTYIGRLSIDQATNQSLTANTNGTMLTWLRSGPGPEFWRVTFERSSDGLTFGTTETGIRVAEGWMMDDLGLPFDENIYYRIRGYTTGANANGSNWYVETIWNLYLRTTKTYLPMIIK
jgi:uncharacterized delta-60 repeat protein